MRSYIEPDSSNVEVLTMAADELTDKEDTVNVIDFQGDATMETPLKKDSAISPADRSTGSKAVCVSCLKKRTQIKKKREALGQLVRERIEFFNGLWSKQAKQPKHHSSRQQQHPSPQWDTFLAQTRPFKSSYVIQCAI